MILALNCFMICSFICSSKATPAQVNLIAGTLGFRREHLPITYLGAPLAVGKRKRVLFDGILAKVRSRILGQIFIFRWKNYSN